LVNKIKRKLNEFLPEDVVEQFLNNKRFPGAIVKYLEGTKMEDLAGDAFILLLNVMTEDTFNVVTDKFI